MPDACLIMLVLMSQGKFGEVRTPLVPKTRYWWSDENVTTLSPRGNRERATQSNKHKYAVNMGLHEKLCL